MDSSEKLILTSKERVPETLDAAEAQWTALLEGLGVTLATETISDTNQAAIEASTENEIVQALNHLYREIAELETDEEKKSFIQSHKLLRFILTSNREIREKWDMMDQLHPVVE